MNPIDLRRLHYTTATGLLGMFKDYSAEEPNIKLWATHYKYMNDPQEFELGSMYCTEIINDIENDLNVPSQYRYKTWVSKKLYTDVIDNNRRTTDGQLTCPYIISFSKAYDSLHMWDMYASNGNGLALVFDYSKLLLNAGICLKDCYYCNPDCHNVFQCLLQKYKDDIKEIYLKEAKNFPIETLEKGIEKGDYSALYSRIYSLQTLINGHIGIRIKHWAYRIEDESRISVNCKNNFKLLFRDRKGIILPYIEYPVPFDCVDHIIVGPTSDFNRVRESILIFLHSKGVKDWDKNKILKSKVPYRL